VSVSGGGTVGSAYAHDGSGGIYDVDWHYRTDVSFGAMAGEILTVWVRQDTSSGGRAYIGFCASSAGTNSLVLAGNTTELVFQNNSSWGYADVASATQSYTAGQWYYVEIENLGGGNYAGRLYASDGATLLNTINYNFSASCPGGVALRSFGGISIDSIAIMGS
jgi:hypothetical protein